VLLKDTANFTGEQSVIPDVDSTNGTDIILIEKIKARLEKLCPDVVSCADIIAVAAKDSVVAVSTQIVGETTICFWHIKKEKLLEHLELAYTKRDRKREKISD